MQRIDDVSEGCIFCSSYCHLKKSESCPIKSCIQIQNLLGIDLLLTDIQIADISGLIRLLVMSIYMKSTFIDC